jgi:hypothetical protein
VNIGAILSCEGGCPNGMAPWLEPWTWDDYDVAGKALVLGALAAIAFAASLLADRFWIAVGCLGASAVLLRYPFFAGLTGSGRLVFAYGPLLGVGALISARAGRAPGYAFPKARIVK